MKWDRKPLVAAKVQQLSLLCTSPRSQEIHCTQAGLTGVLRAAVSHVALQAGSQERMAGFSHLSQEGGPVCRAVKKTVVFFTKRPGAPYWFFLLAF